MDEAKKVTRDPDFTGAHAQKAWRARLTEKRARPDLGGTVRSWLCTFPGYNIMWPQWQMAVVHLRPLEGVKPAHLSAPGMTHEFIFGAIDPGTPLEIEQLEDWISGAAEMPERSFLLSPIDLVHQVAVPSDRDAGELLDIAVELCIRGSHSPDSDYRSFWRGWLDGTAAEVRRRS